MTSLSEVYDGDHRTRASLRRLYLGTALFLLGALLVVTAIIVTTTDLLLGMGWTLMETREAGGILAGIGVPAVFIGIFSVLPANRETRAAAVIGALIALMGVGLFWHAYPCHWSGSNCGAGLTDLTLPTVGVYFFGTITTFWCLFAGVANFKTRNDPGGTVKMEVTRKGETKIIEVPRRSVGSGLGGIGFFGSTPSGDVATQTNTTSASGGSGATTSTSISSDGGSTTTDIRSPMDEAELNTNTGADNREFSGAEVVGEERQPAGDAYCGSCAHFEYVRTERGLRPYCALDEELMDDMDACEQWTRRSRSAVTHD